MRIALQRNELLDMQPVAVATHGRVMTLACVAPLLILPLLATVRFVHAPAWQWMWSLAIAIYSGLKWLSFASHPAARRATWGRSAAYLLLWPGMNAPAFFATNTIVPRPGKREWLLAIAKTIGGGLLLRVGVPPLVETHPLIAGWVGMTGIAFVLHFGILHMLSLLWRQNGIDAEPIMHSPVRATSLSDFWGRRWNLAFRDLAFTFVFRPLIDITGVIAATMAVFIASGLIHDLAISLPARGGWGLPTLYFVLQGCGQLLERSPFGKRWGLGRGLIGRAYCVLFVVGPVTLLFHPPFIRAVVLPTLSALGVF